VLEDEYVQIAWMYHMEGLTQAEIADRMGTTRLAVQRALQKCLDDGIVRVSIEHVDSRCARLASSLQKEFELTYAHVIPTPSNDERLKEALGKASARAFARYVKPGSVIGVGWGSTIAQTARHMSRRQVDGLTVVSLLGGLTKGAAISPYEVAWRISDVLGATCYYLAAPAIVDDQATRDMLLGISTIQTTLELGRQASLALIGIGEVSHHCTFARVGMITPEEIDELAEKGAVADILGTFVTLDGEPVDHNINQRTVSPGLETLKQIGNVFAVAGGTSKARTIYAALQTGCIRYLVTDAQAAENVLLLKDLMSSRRPGE